MSINSLYKSLLSGDTSAENRLFQHLSDRFTHFIRLKIEDPDARQEVVQETLTAIAEKYRKIDFEKSFAAWAYSVLENKVKNYYHSSRVNRSRMSDLDMAAFLSAEPEIDLGVRDRLLNCLKEAVRINKRYARILNLHYQGYSIQEICSRMELTRNGAYLLLSRGRTMLRECLRKKEQRNG